MTDAVRLSLFFLLLCVAAIWDMKKRMVPDTLCFMIAAVSLIPIEPARFCGILAALPLLCAGMTIGGIGGGDIKLTGATGLVLGFTKTVTGLMLALVLLIVFHGLRSTGKKIRQRQGVPKLKMEENENREQAYPLVPFLVLGMAVSILY